MLFRGWIQLLRRGFKSLSPLSITLLYGVFGFLWITFSDRIAASMATTGEELTQLQTLKGWIFIGLSCAFIFGLVKMHDEAISTRETRLNRQSEQLQVFNRVLRHNIRNELTIILGRLDMENHHGERLGEAVVEDLNRIERAAQRILRVAEKARRVDQFDITQEKETRNIVESLQEQVEDFEDEYPDVEIEADFPDFVPVATYGTLSIAFYELMENAIIHNDTGCDPKRVFVSLETSMASTAELTIRDNGPGIRQSEVKPIIEGEETPLEHGSSIGLWLTRWVVNDHGGELDLSAVESGTEARLTLPVQPIDQLRSSVTAIRG
jgi:signal transduction histidine kinase